MSHQLVGRIYMEKCTKSVFPPIHFLGFSFNHRSRSKLYPGIIFHCSPESNLVNFGPPKKLTTDSECSWHGDFGSEVGFGASSCATETVISL